MQVRKVVEGARESSESVCVGVRACAGGGGCIPGSPQRGLEKDGICYLQMAINGSVFLINGILAVHLYSILLGREESSLCAGR